MCREIAIQLLEEAIPIDEEYCWIPSVKLSIADKNLLLKQLINDEDYLAVPLPLYFYSPFWRQIKAESNRRCHTTQNTQGGNKNV